MGRAGRCVLCGILRPAVVLVPVPHVSAVAEFIVAFLVVAVVVLGVPNTLRGLAMLLVAPLEEGAITLVGLVEVRMAAFGPVTINQLLVLSLPESHPPPSLSPSHSELISTDDFLKYISE